mmetsp:Transcript_63194/g.196061  ORF Transcript_63194/g.196061 Transcript_63194/m.196061 type:complete len:150 (-) Transcript_63194:109-558(-)
MQLSFGVVALCLLAAQPAASVVAQLRGRDSPEEIKLDMEHRSKDSFGKDVTPPCSKIECGKYECPPDFELKVDGTCCGYCWAPDHRVAVDRHVAVAYNSTGFAVEQCESAPSVCRGPGKSVVRCFKPSCRAGDKATCVSGNCCPTCTTR